jgi:hypothetical protein
VDKVIANPKGKSFDRVREVMRSHYYSLRTEKAYGQWIPARVKRDGITWMR